MVTRQHDYRIRLRVVVGEQADRRLARRGAVADDDVADMIRGTAQVERLVIGGTLRAAAAQDVRTRTVARSSIMLRPDATATGALPRPVLHHRLIQQVPVRRGLRVVRAVTRTQPRGRLARGGGDAGERGLGSRPSRLRRDGRGARVARVACEQAARRRAEKTAGAGMRMSGAKHRDRDGSATVRLRVCPCS